MRRFAARASALLLVLSVFGLSALAASPALHKALHPDASSADHHCAITLLAKGQVNFADVSLPVLGAAVLFGGIALLSEHLILPVADYRFSQSRAPPASILS